MLRGYPARNRQTGEKTCGPNCITVANQALNFQASTFNISLQAVGCETLEIMWRIMQRINERH